MKRIALTLTAMLTICSSALCQDVVEDIISKMTTREKVAQLFVCSLSASQSDTERQAQQVEWAKAGLGGFIVMDSKLLECMTTVNKVQSYAKIPMMISIDGEWGASMRFSEFPFFPRQMQLGALPSEKLIYEMGLAIGKEMKLLKIGVNYAPVVDVNCNPKNPVINTRSFGEDREKVAKYGLAYALGMQAEAISACAKHFPGHGDTAVDSHKDLPLIPFSKSRLDSMELYPFKKCIDGGIDMIMLGHLNVPALDPTGTPSSVSYPIVTELLRKEMGFNGIIVTDALSMRGVTAFFEGSGPNTCLASYKAGVDILLMPKDPVGSIDLITSKIESGELGMDDLNNRVRKVLKMKEKQGLLAEGYDKTVSLDGLVQAADNQPTKELIAKISQQSIITVKKPLDGKMLKGKVAYLALGAGNEKKVPTMDEEENPNIPKPGFGGPNDYGARRGIGKSGAAVAGDILSKYGKADCFYLPRNFQIMDLIKVKEKLAEYKTVIVGFHDTDSRPQKNFGITEPAIYQFIGEWAKEQDLVGLYFGSPYALDLMPWYRDFRGFVIAWADNVYNGEAAAKIVCGKMKSVGVLPVGAGGLPCGYKAE